MTVMSSYECQPLVLTAAQIPHEDDQATVASSDETVSCSEVHLKLQLPKLPIENSPKAGSTRASVGRMTYIYIPEYWTGPGR
jgi:hypothetical protein